VSIAYNTFARLPVLIMIDSEESNLCQILWETRQADKVQ